MYNYPLCPDAVVATEGTRPRPDTHTIMKCVETGDFFMQHANGKHYPLQDRTDPDSDAVSRVVD